MKLFYGLLWTLFHVCWMLEAPKLVISSLGGSAIISCKYRRGDEEAVKYWCKEGSFRFCSRNRTIRTTGAEKEVKQNGMSIKDNHVRLEFNVVMENLTYNDAGTYLCGVERKYDTWKPVELIVLADNVFTPTSRNKEDKTVEPSEPPLSPERNQLRSLDFILLILKIAIFLTMLAAILWLHIWYRRGKHSRVQISETEGSKRIMNDFISFNCIQILTSRFSSICLFLTLERTKNLPDFTPRSFMTALIMMAVARVFPTTL